MQRPTHRAARLAVVALMLAATACGTRLDKSDIVAAQNGKEAAGSGSTSVALPSAGGSSADLSGAAPAASSSGSGVTSDIALPATPGAPTPAAGATPGAAVATGSGSGRSAATASGAAAPTVSGARTAAAPAAGGPASAGSPAASAQGGAAAPAPGAGPAAPAPSGPGTGAPILVGAVGQTSGIVGAAVGPALPALQAWAASVNDAGGIKGHPVKLFFADDGGDPARHRQLVQQLVEKDHVTTFVMHFTPLAGQSSVDYLTQKRIPVLGDSGAGQWFYQSPMYFPQMSTGAVWVKAMIFAAAAETIPQGKKKLAILNCQEAQFCVDADKMWPGLAPKVGYELVYSRQASLAQPDYTAECLGARNAGADVFGMAMDGNAIGRIASACARVGFHPVYFIHHSALLLDHAKDPNVDGMIVPLATRAWFDASNPVVGAYQKALATYVPGAEAKDSSFVGWAAGKQFEAAANAAPDPTTSEGILEGLWSLKDNTFGDISYPHTFNREKPTTEVLCFYVVRGSQGKWAYTQQGSQLRCPAT